jgi:hypothetical protein
MFPAIRQAPNAKLMPPYTVAAQIRRNVFIIRRSKGCSQEEARTT